MNFTDKLSKINPEKIDFKILTNSFMRFYDAYYVLKYSKLPCRYESEDYSYDTEKTHESISSGLLSDLTIVTYDVSYKNNELIYDKIILNSNKYEAIFVLDRKNNFYSLNIYYANEFNQLIKNLLIQLETELKVDETKNGTFYMLNSDLNRNLYLRKTELKFKDVTIEKMYTDTVLEFDKQIQQNLVKKESGLFILHGPPGTGKTSYINYLIQKINKKFVFIPSNLVDSLVLPEFLELLFKFKNSVLIIEDAENALKTRINNKNSPVSGLLNLTNGLIGDVLDIIVICTINSELKNIDEALLRKGRLKGKCYFGKLSAEKANSLSQILNNNNNKFIEETTLADVFQNDEVVFGENQLKTIGFN